MIKPHLDPLLDGFVQQQLDLGEIEILVSQAGQGEPLLLLHGWPQRHVIWHRMATQLAQHFTVIATDLRGYGDSSKPVGLPDHS
ncbi:alpha/beta fold hydrolase, partial [Acinetobacter baumannii]